MPRSILVPLDGSPLAEQALPLAEAIAKASRARIRLAMVHRLPPSPVDRDGAQLFLAMELASRRSESLYLRRIANEIRGRPRSEVRTALLEGPVGPALNGFVRDMRVDMIVMSTHGRGALERLWLGSVADFLVRTAEVPVLLVRPTEKPKARPSAARPRRILVPLDGSPLAEGALGPAAGLAKLLGVELVVVQVVMPVAPATDPLPHRLRSPVLRPLARAGGRLPARRLGAPAGAGGARHVRDRVGVLGCPDPSGSRARRQRRAHRAGHSRTRRAAAPHDRQRGGQVDPRREWAGARRAAREGPDALYAPAAPMTVTTGASSPCPRPAPRASWGVLSMRGA